MNGSNFKIAKRIQHPSVQSDVVAIYDNAGIPSFMYRFTRMSNKELFGGTDKPHPAFVIGGEVYDEIYISVYENCNINGKPYSLPYQKPWTYITNDEASKACFSKGEGWHLMTASEWGLIANLCYANGTLPHGNTDWGTYHANPEEKGITYITDVDHGFDNHILTGSGPATWTHNHKSDGVHDLCGNINEHVRGLRLKNGALQKIKNNDAALDIDTTENNNWINILSDNKKPIYVNLFMGTTAYKMTLCTNPVKYKPPRPSRGPWDDARYFSQESTYEKTHRTFSTTWDDLQYYTAEQIMQSEQLKELALYDGEPDAYCGMNTTKNEFLATRGGCWSGKKWSGVFNINLEHTRSYKNISCGFRSAYFKKKS